VDRTRHSAGDDDLVRLSHMTVFPCFFAVR
jgi:hypothetical protein